MKRRSFVAMTASVTVAAGAGPAGKRESMLNWLAGKPEAGYTPAAFFLHFGPEFKNGSPAARKHMEFFRQTDMDFVKIQFEQTYQRQPYLQKPADWARLKFEKIDFYEPLIQTTRELVKAAKKDALVVMTLYSPYMCAGHCAGAPLLRAHLEENPDAVKKGLDILTDSQMLFVRACIDAGVDGFYMSTQGSEAKHMAKPEIFTRYIKPADQVAMKEAAARCPFNILHVCDYVAPYANYDAVVDYPGQVVNCNPKLTGRALGWDEITRMFRRPGMGGMDRHGVLLTGTPAQVEAEVKRVVKSAPRQFILGADCTVPNETDWTRLRSAIDAAHRTGA